MCRITMSDEFQWPEPAWLAELPPKEQAECRVKFALALAAIYANPDHSILQLSSDVGLGKTTLSAAKTRGRVSGEMATRIETFMGRRLFPWHFFRPELISAQE
jgi:hypothetical protein